MKAEFIRIALAKTTDPQMRVALARIESLAENYEDGERGFVSQITHNKASRGESPVKLQKAKREQVHQLSKDQAEIDVALCLELQGLADAREVIQAVHAGMSANLDSSRSLLKHFHPDDLPVAQDLFSRQEALVLSMADFLSMQDGL